MSGDFASLSAVQLPTPCRLLASACCPDKDLLVLVSRLGSHDKISLWKMQGSKTWEVDVSTDSERIVGVAWSPDGQSVAVAHDPPSISLHSIQDGHSERVICIPTFNAPISQLTSIWWFHQEKPEKSPIPDIFKRNNIITGSAHSILRTLPLLDPLRDDSQQLTATDLFAFQGSQTTARRATSIPDVIKRWPSLQLDPVFASVNLPNATKTVENGIVDEVDDANLDSILAVADRAGHLSCFLDGTYPIGTIQLGRSKDNAVASLFKHPERPVLLAHPVNNGPSTDLLPTHISLSLLEERKVRDLARLSTTARELCWYILRIVEEMRAAWFGSDTTTGARELGPKWIKSYETKQQEQYGLKPNAILDLTSLLVTDRPTEPLADYLGSGQQMSERGIQKWDSAVTEALVKLRDYSEKRLVPACQRLHLVLGEVRGWASLPTQYSAFEISSESVAYCLIAVKRTILLATWLAAATRRENNRFREFMTWLRYETVILNPSPATETSVPIRHDILEVNQYLMSGLEKSTIDKWFTGPVPTFAPQDLGIFGYDLSMKSALQKAEEHLENPVRAATETQDRFDHKSLEDIDRNLEALIKSLVTSCREVFDRPSGATTRSATISVGFGSLQQGRPAASSPNSQNDLLVRERTSVAKDGGQYVQYLVLHAPSNSEHRAFVVFVHQRYGHDNSHVEVALHECCVSGEMAEDVVGVDLLALEFFDDETIVMVYRTGEEGQACIATLSYGDLGYQEFQPPEGYVTVSRESLIESASQGLNAGQLTSGCLPIKQSRALKGCKSGTVSLAVNGRVGRRVACVLDSKGTMLETFDLEGDEGEEGDTTVD